jgi:Spy/CpxP family protein refolding chaperone
MVFGRRFQPIGRRTMSRSKIILLATFVLVLSAGMVVGRLWATLPVMTVTPPTTQPSQQPWWAAQLDLTAQQRQQIDAIWAEAKPKVAETFDRRRALDRKREEAVEDLLGPAQYAAYEKIFDDFYAQRADIDKDRQKLIHDAEDRTKALLNDTQLKQLEALGPHEGRGPHGLGGGAGGGGGGHHSLQTSTTMPAAAGGDGIRPQ